MNTITAPITDDANPRSLVFGGYRWKNDLAVEAAFNTADKYALRPARAGLTVGPGLGLTLGDFATRTWKWQPSSIRRPISTGC